MGDDFESILASARAGDQRAWTCIYEDLAPVVLGYLRGQRATHAEDTTSEVFLQVVRDLGHFSGDESNFRSWVFTIAHHRLIDARRAATRRPSDPTPSEEIDPLLPASEAEPLALSNVTTEEIQRLCEILTDQQRTLVLLRFVSGLTLPEIAEVMGKRVGAVKAMQRRALAMLRKELASDPYPFGVDVTLTQV